MTEHMQEQARTASNLANANTIGYKRDRMFAETLEEWIDAEEAPQSLRSRAQAADFAPGALEETGNPLDVALKDEGLFVVTDEATGAATYTRAGRFVLDADGLLRSPDGGLVDGVNGPIQIPENTAEIAIRTNGEVSADGQAVGQIRVVWFDNPAALQRTDGAGFEAAGQEPIDLDAPTVVQGFVETSNVNPIHEMTEMITHFRLFESQQRLQTTQDGILSRVSRELGRF